MPDDWTLVSLKEHLETQIDGLRDNVNTALTAADKALSKAEQASERRFEGVNEFRKALGDQATTFLPRAEFQAEFKILLQKHDALEQQFRDLKGETAGRSKGMVSAGQVVVVVLTLALAFSAVAVSIIFRH